MRETLLIEDMSNSQFLQEYASAGLVGLVGASHFIDYGIKKAQKLVRIDREEGEWTHAFLCEGKRIDGEHWILESDLDIAERHFRFGVQENRISKYANEEDYPQIAFLDFGLDEEQLKVVLSTGLSLLSEQWKYSIRELLGTLLALPSRRLKKRKNLLDKERSLYCSAFVQHLFMKAGIDFADSVHEKNTAPEHIFASPACKRAVILKRNRCF